MVRKTKAQTAFETADKEVVVTGNSRKVQFMETENKPSSKKSAKELVEPADIQETPDSTTSPEPETLGKRVRKQTVKFEIASFKSRPTTTAIITSNSKSSSSTPSETKRSAKKKKTDSDEKEASVSKKTTSGRKRKLAAENDEDADELVKADIELDDESAGSEEATNDKRQKRGNKTKPNKAESDDSSESIEEREPAVETPAAKLESKSKKSNSKKIDRVDQNGDEPTTDKRSRKRTDNKKTTQEQKVVTEASQPQPEDVESDNINEPEVDQDEPEPVKVKGKQGAKKTEAKETKQTAKSKQSKANKIAVEEAEEKSDDKKEEQEKMAEEEERLDEEEKKEEELLSPAIAPAATKSRGRNKQATKKPEIAVPAEMSEKKQPNGKSRPSQGICRIVSWNVAGARACFKKGDTVPALLDQDADVICFQEVKATQEQFESDIKDFKEQFVDYHVYWNCEGDKKGYAGVAVLSRFEPIAITYGMNQKEFDQEGRMITLEFENFFLVNAYVPNASTGLKRLDYKVEWDEAFRQYLAELDNQKPVVACGDFNVAHTEMDLANPKANVKSPGFTPEERDDFTQLLGEGFIDSFRHLYPNEKDAYTFWSNRTNARSRNVGWRLDYFVLSERLADKIKDNVILKDIMGSDHCPILLNFNLHPEKA